MTTEAAAPTSKATVTTKAAQGKATYPNLASALVAFQTDIPVPTKSGTNPHFKSKYAPLDVTTPIITKALTAVGIAWTASPGYHESGQYGVVGRLTHEAGEAIEGFFPVTVTKPQEIGSAFTYARRYLLESLTGVAPEGGDDDGAAAQAGAVQAEAAKTAQAQAAKDADVLTPLKARVKELLLGNGSLPEGLDDAATGAKIKELGDAHFGRAGWASSDVALAKWISALENPEADPATGEVKS